jgi:hypothetical protein
MEEKLDIITAAKTCDKKEETILIFKNIKGIMPTEEGDITASQLRKLLKQILQKVATE